MFTTPGHANAIPGLTFAYHMETPVVNISGSATQDRLGLGASQEIDQVGMAKPVTKGAWLLETRSERRNTSPAHSAPHSTVVAAPCTSRSRSTFRKLPSPQSKSPTARWKRRARGPAHAAQADIRAAVDLLQAAERPLIITANGAYTVQREDIERLVETTGILYFTEQSARGVISDDHPLCAGYSDGRVNDAAKSIHEADALLLLGKKLDYTIPSAARLPSARRRRSSRSSPHGSRSQRRAT